MDRARPFEYVYRLPVRTTEELKYSEAVYDRQVALNETWRSYALRKNRLDEVEDEHVKWVTRTWEDDEEARIAQRRFLEEANAQGEQQIATRKEELKAKQARSGATVAHIMAFQDQILADRTPCRHNLYVDFDLLQQKKFIGEQTVLATEELFLRLFQEEGVSELCDGLFLIGECHRIFSLMKMNERIQREEEERQRLEEERQKALEEERIREEMRQKELEEAERLRKEAVEQAKMLERKRREEERRAKARSERERLKHHHSTSDGGVSADKNPRLTAMEEVLPVTAEAVAPGVNLEADILQQGRIVFVQPKGNDTIELIRSGSSILAGVGRDSSYVLKIDKPMMRSTVICQGGCYLGDDQKNEDCHILGKTIMGNNAISIASEKLHGTLTDSFEQYSSSRVEYIKNSRADTRCFLFDPSGEKQDESIIFLPLLLSGFSYAPYVFAVSRQGEDSFQLNEVEEAAKVVWELIQMIDANMEKERKKQLCQECVDWLSTVTGCKNCYVSLQDEGNKSMTYLAATPSQSFMIGKKHSLNEEESGCGISFNACNAATNQGDSMICLIDNVNDSSCIPFQNQRIKIFSDSEKTGSLLLGTITGKESNGNCVSLGVVFLDSLGTEKKFTESDKEILKNAVHILVDLLLKSSRVFTLGKPLKIEEELEFLGPSPIIFLKSLWGYALDNVSRITSDQLLELARYMHPPPIIPLVVQATLIVALGSKPKKVEQWGDAREKVNNILLTKMSAFDPTDRKRRKWAFFTRAGKILKGYGAKDVLEKGSYPTSCLFLWTFAAILLRKQADLLRRRYERGPILASGADAAGSLTDDDNDNSIADDDDDDDNVDIDEIKCDPEEI